MSGNKHTPEPWRTDAECGFPQDIHDSKGNLFLRCGSDFDNEIYGEANARRIVACVNRLAQFTTEQIEDFGYDLFAEDRPRLVEAQNEIHLLKKQRDELLAAFERFMDSHEECTDFDGFTAQIVSMADYHQAQESIARVKEKK